MSKESTATSPERGLVPATTLAPPVSYSRRRFNQAATDTRQKLKQDMGVSSLAGIVVAGIQASTAGFSLTTILLSVGAFSLMLIAFFLYYYIFTAPAKIDKERQDEIAQAGEQLRLAQAEKQNLLEGQVAAQCPDKWLHEIALANKVEIHRYVIVTELTTSRHDLFHIKPYIDFTFNIFNASIYQISINDEVKGSIFFHARLLSEDAEIVDNMARNISPAHPARFTLRQWLSKEDVAHILSAPPGYDHFKFDGLTIIIKGGGRTPEVEPQKLNTHGEKLSSKVLREVYRKLDIVVMQPTLRTYINLRDNTEGSLLTAKVRVDNSRGVSIDINEFRLMMTAGGRIYGGIAQVGEISEDGYINSKGEVKLKGEILNNLRPSNGSLVIESGRHREGWLQFIIEGATPHDLNGNSATLALVDTFFEEHCVQFVPRYGPH